MVTNESKTRRTFSGVVTSDKMDKTIVVAINRTFKHPVFKKYLQQVTRYKVRDIDNVAKIGDHVEFYEGRPFSKTGYMYLLRVLSKDHSLEK